MSVHKTCASIGFLKVLPIGIEQIARLAGVSIGTVDRALHGRKGISEATRRRVLEIVRGLGYETNLAARALARGGGNLSIGVCLPGEFHSFYGQIRDGVFAEASRFKWLGVALDYRPLDRLGHGEIEAVRAMAATGVRAIIMTPGDPASVGPEISRAVEQGISVVCVASDAAGSARSTVICVKPEINGALAAELLGKFTAPGSRVAVVAGILRTDDQQLKTRAFKDAFPLYCPGGEVVEVIEGHDDEEETLHASFGLLRRHPSLDGIYVSNAMCVPVCRALRESGRIGQTRLVATDLFRHMAPFFENSAISASIYQRPYVQGQTAVRLVIDHLIKGQNIPTTHYLNPAIVFCSNLHLFREMQGPEGGESRRQGDFAERHPAA